VFGGVTTIDDRPAWRRCSQDRPTALFGGNPSEYDPQANTLWLKLTDASNNTSWFPIQLSQYPQSVDYTGAA
jgi:hypothetical protein